MRDPIANPDKYALFPIADVEAIRRERDEAIEGERQAVQRKRRYERERDEERAEATRLASELNKANREVVRLQTVSWREANLPARQSIADVLERVVDYIPHGFDDREPALRTEVRDLRDRLRQGCQAQAESEC